MQDAETKVILPQKQLYAFGALSATCWHAGQRQPSGPSVNIEPFKFVIKLWTSPLYLAFIFCSSVL